MNEKGIALIQVLVLTAILSVLVLYFSSVAKQQVTLAQHENDKVETLVEAQSLQNEILYSLLSENIQLTGESGKGKISSVWNFHSDGFELDGFLVELQDISGLLNAHFPNSERLSKLFVFNGSSREDADSLVAKISDWQDIDNNVRAGGAEARDYGGPHLIRNGYIPDARDFAFVQGVSRKHVTLLDKYTSIWRKSSFNPMNAPEFLLRSLIGNNAYKQVEQARNAKTIDRRRFRELSGLNESEDVFLATSNSFRLTIQKSNTKVSYIRKVNFSISPHAVIGQSPVVIHSEEW